MNLSNWEDGSVEGMPLTAVLGEIYTRRQTGTLKVFDGGAQFPVVVFWFKRGLPCFSYSSDKKTRLGEFFDKPLRKVARKAARRQKKDDASARRLLGQVMLSLGYLTPQLLEETLTLQIKQRLLCVTTLGLPRFQFVEGTSEFAVVPVSSPLVNPLEVAAAAARQSDPDALARYVETAATASSVRLALNRRMPPVLRKHLSTELLDALVEEHEAESLFADAHRLPTMVFLMAFGYVEFLQPATRELPPEPQVTQSAPRSSQSASIRPVEALAHLVGLVRSGATHYEVMGLALDAPAHLIKQRYRELAFQIHPDRVPGDSAHLSREVFANIVDAYHHLSKERLRVEYDLQLVLSEEWGRLGSGDDVANRLSRRREHLTRIGLAHLAQDYARMSELVNYRPVGQEPFETEPGFRQV